MLLAIVLAAIVIIRMATLPSAVATTVLAGSVLKQNSDPLKQTPIAGVAVKAVGGARLVTAKTDPSGLFNITFNPGLGKGQPVVLTFVHPDYELLEMNAKKPGDQLYIAHLQARQPETEMGLKRTGAAEKNVEIKNVRVRYSFKNESTVGVGSMAKQFTASNTGNEPCRNRKPCSPDGRWKATTTVFALSAEEGNSFSNVRVSCVSGPCAFTRIDPDHFEGAERKLSVSVLNWSDTAAFLVEADVARTMVTDEVRHSYPYIIGQTMNFALPPSSEGPSIEADLDGQYIAFPLGPALILSWGDCSVEVSPDNNKIYRCQLKPGYRLQN